MPTFNSEGERWQLWQFALSFNNFIMEFLCKFSINNFCYKSSFLNLIWHRKCRKKIMEIPSVWTIHIFFNNVSMYHSDREIETISQSSWGDFHFFCVKDVWELLKCCCLCSKRHFDMAISNPQHWVISSLFSDLFLYIFWQHTHTFCVAL